MIKFKTDTYFVISNFNTYPENLLEYCENYIIYDQSNDASIKSRLKATNWNVSFVEHTGHNLSDYFRFFISYYDNLPSCIMLLKGNIIGRHVSQEFFDNNYNNKYFTPFFSDKKLQSAGLLAFQLFEGAYLELNTEWYIRAKPFKYFETYNQLLQFIFVDPIIPKWLYFSPGACYIVTSEQVKKYPRQFYENLKYIVSYNFFPSEAYHVERMLYVIFNGNYQINEHMLSSTLFFEKLALINDTKPQSRKFINTYTLFDLLQLQKSIFKQMLKDFKRIFL
jgi:hypothetical protein